MRTHELPAAIAGLAEARDSAWDEFLDAYSPVLLQVVRLFERDPDRSADCFLFVCQALRRNRFRRLRRYRASGPASFTTWLRAVARNLCLDWRRSRLGRRQLPAWVIDLAPLEREAFLLLYRRGLTVDETIGALRTLYPRLSTGDCLQAIEDLEEKRAAGRHRARTVWRPRRVSLEPLPRTGDGSAEAEVRDSGPDPEELAAVREQSARLARAVAELSPDERLLVRLRFAEDLPLAEVARLLGLGNAQAADRRIRAALRRLRARLGEPAEAPSSDSV